MPDQIVPAAIVAAPFVVTFDPGRFEATYGFCRDEDSDDPRVNLRLPFGLRRCPG